MGVVKVIWIVCFGWWLGLACFLMGIAMCATVVGAYFSSGFFSAGNFLFNPFADY